jgi:hypothetical protein
VTALPPVPAAFPAFVAGQFKVNGVTTNANAVLGYLYANVPFTINKGNRIVDVSGDSTIAPIYWGLISDPDLIDAPLYHQGFL